MGRVERLLEIGVDVQRPVVEVGIVTLLAMGFNAGHTGFHGFGDPSRIINDELIAATGVVAQRHANEAVDGTQVVFGFLRAGNHHRVRNVLVVRVGQNAEQVQQLFGSARATRENHNAVGHAHEGFQTFFDIGQDHQLVNDRVGGFGGNDAGLGNTHITAVLFVLLGMANHGAFHWAFHGARAATGANVQTAQAQLVTNFLGVFVFVAGNRVTAPAHHQIGQSFGFQYIGIAQQMENGVGNVVAVVQIEAVRLDDGVAGVEHIAQHREQLLAHAANDFVVDKRAGGWVDQLQYQTAIFLFKLNIKLLVFLFNFNIAVLHAAGAQHRIAATAYQIVGFAADITQLLNFVAGQYPHVGFRVNQFVLLHKTSSLLQPSGPVHVRRTM